jgi:hypothetical protein
MDSFCIKIVLLVLISNTITVRAQNERANCGQVCPRSFPRFISPEVGKTYVYNLETNTLINVKETQSVGIKARVEITAHSVCEFSLQLREVELTGIPDPTEMQDLLQLNPLQFGSFDGKVLGVCPADNEEIWALNVKKSILSALQMTAKSVTEESIVKESDFSGLCDTSYKPSTSDDSTITTIEKTKTLNNCEKRRKNIRGFNSQSLSLLTEFLRQKLPILKSDSVCTQQLQNNIITSVTCNEDQTLEFRENSIVSSSLTLKFVEKTTAAPKKREINKDSQSLLMSRNEESPKEALESDVLSLLRVLCSQISGEKISPEVTENFHSLVLSLKTLSESATQRIDTAVKSGEICSSPKLRDLFIGASAFAASDPSIQTIIKAYNNNEFSLTRATILFSLIALKSKPSEQTINSLVPLLESKEVSRPLILGISLLIKSYCEKNSDCEKSTVIKRSVDAILQKLQHYDCNLERITSIKAIDNINPKSDESVKKNMMTIATNKSSDAGVRVAAIQALTGMTDNSIKDQLLEILREESEDVDVRVAAYKSVVTSSPTAQQWETIRSVNDAKIANYIKTHISNLKKSSNPNRRKILDQNAPEFEEPPFNSLAITRNMEFSYRGTTIETDVIHPKDSPVPSLLNFNVWLPVYGNDFHLLELSIRHVGLDAHLKKVINRGIIGPEISLRIAEELMEFIEHIKNPSPTHNIILQISVKMSGKNILFVDTFEDIHAISTFLIERIKEISRKDSLDRALGAVLLDSAVEIPTLNGFPMIVHLNETIVDAVKAIGDIEAIEAKPFLKSNTRKLRIKGSLQVELSAGANIRVGREAMPGFKYQMLFKFDPVIDAMVESKDGRILKARINLPKEKQTLIKLTQKTRLIDSKGLLKESNEVSDNGQESGEVLSECKTLYGLSICKSKTPYEDSPIPNVEIYLSKIDNTMEAIELHLETPPKDSKEMNVWIARVNATNSEVNREYSAELELFNPSEGKKEAQLKLRSPINLYSTRASLQSERDGSSSRMEIEVNCPYSGQFKIKSNVNTTSDTRSLDMKIDYKLLQSKWESINLNEKITYNTKELKKGKKSKMINFILYGQLNSTQFPKYNSQISYHMNYRPYVNKKSELTIEWNEDYRDKIRYSHTSKMDLSNLRPFKMTTENAFVFEATPFDINYEFKVETDMAIVKGRPQLLTIDLIGKDVKGREDMEIKGYLHYERTDSPLIQTINSTLKYPGRELFYWSVVKQIKDLTFAGTTKYQLQKGRIVTVVHNESITNPTKDFRIESNVDISYSDIPDKYSRYVVLGIREYNVDYQYRLIHNGEKFHEQALKLDEKGPLRVYGYYEEKSFEIKVDSIWNPRSAEVEIKNNQKYYKINSQRVPKQSLTIKVDSTLNSRIKEMEIHLSKVNKSSIKLLTNEELDLKGNIDLISKNKRAHIRIESPKIGYSHVGDIKYLGAEQLLTIDSKTNKSGKPYITIEGQFSRHNRSVLIIKKIKSADNVSKFEYFYDKGSYGLVIESSRFTAFVEGENKAKYFGKLGFFDKMHNYEHKSNYNVTNGVLFIQSVSNKEKKQFTKLDAVIGLKRISELELITPTINANLRANPLGARKTLNFNWVSPRYEQKTVIEVVPESEIKVESLSQRKVEPFERFKVDALITRNNDSFVSLSVPSLDWSARKTKSVMPKVIFNMTLNGYNEVQEYDVNKNFHPLTNAIVILLKYMKTFIVNA